MSRPIRDLRDLREPPTVTFHRSTLVWSIVAILLAWIGSVWWAHECGETDYAERVAHEANERAHSASVEAGR